MSLRALSEEGGREVGRVNGRSRSHSNFAPLNFKPLQQIPDFLTSTAVRRVNFGGIIEKRLEY